MFVPNSSHFWFSRFKGVSLGFLALLLVALGSVFLFQQQPPAGVEVPLTAPLLPAFTSDESPPSVREKSLPDSAAVVSLAVNIPPERVTETMDTPKAETVRPVEEWQGQSVTILRGDTISNIVLKVYGSYNVLALDLIKESNPHIADMDSIAVGERLWLPALTQEALFRKQLDGSYQVILGSFHGKGEAERAVRRVRRFGYVAAISEQKMSGTRVLYRVTLEQLQDATAAKQAWGALTRGKA